MSRSDRSYNACSFYLKQNTAYEMRISDWSSDVCSSDLTVARRGDFAVAAQDAEIAAIAGGGERLRLGEGQLVRAPEKVRLDHAGQSAIVSAVTGAVVSSSHSASK